MASFTVTASQLQAAATNLTQLNGQFQQQVGRLIENQAELSAMWEGEANTAFKNEFGKSYESLNDWYRVIAEYINALHQIADAYHRAEMQATDIAKN